MAQLTDLELLEVFDRIPDLLETARARMSSPQDNLYDIQDALREAYYSRGLAFKSSTPYRSIYACPICDYSSTVIQYGLVNPAVEAEDESLHWVEISGRELHNIRAHGGVFPPACRAFLEHLQRCESGSEA